MPPRRPLWQRFWNNELHYTPGRPAVRMRWVTYILVGVLAVFGVRLLQVQVVDAGALADRAASGRMDTSILTAKRGAILDSSGVPLAQSVDASNVVVDQTLVEDPADYAKKLSPIVGLPADKIEASLKGDKRFAYVAKAVAPDAGQRVMDLELPGMATEPTLKRDYPNGALAASVVGFVGGDSAQGMAGVELELNDQLAGKNGERRVEVVDGKLIPTGTDVEKDPVPGSSVKLTIDRDLQFIAQDAITRQVRESKAESGTVILMDVKSGEILAMASVPTIDPNNIGNARPEDMQNRAVVEAFEPGSTSKIMTMAAAINEGKAEPSTSFDVADTIHRGTRDFHDHSPHEPYKLTLAGILAKSSNTGSIQVAERVGPEKFREYLTRFGLGQPTGLGFPGEAGGYVPPIDEWTDSTFPTLSFGQGLSLSALQITSVFQTMANDGVRVQPKLIAATIDDNGKEVPAAEPPTTKVVEPETAKKVLKMMEGVVSEEGTANNANIPGYKVGGKTGTANRVDDSCGCYKGYTSSFIGVVPADDPQLVAAVIVQDPQGAYMGSDNGVPVFKELMTAALQARGVAPTGNTDPLLPVYADTAKTDAATAVQPQQQQPTATAAQPQQQQPTATAAQPQQPQATEAKQ